MTLELYYRCQFILLPIDPVITFHNNEHHCSPEVVHRYSTTQAVVDITKQKLDTKSLCLRGLMWMDAFESNTSMSRVGRSVDLLTTTIGAPVWLNHSSETTYISAVGKKSGDIGLEQGYASDTIKFNNNGDL